MLVLQVSHPDAEFADGPEQGLLHPTLVGVERFCDFPNPPLFEVLEHETYALEVRQLRERTCEFVFELVLLEEPFGFAGTILDVAVERFERARPLLANQRQRGIDGNAVNPGRELRLRPRPGPGFS